MRLFFAGDIPGDQKACLLQIQEKLKTTNAHVKWVQAENFHITFSFLGEVKSERLGMLKKIGEEVAKLYGSFDILFENLGTFPPKGAPHVVWVGVNEGKISLNMLAKALEDRLIKSGFRIEVEQFHPHITLGRVKNPQGLNELLDQARTDIPSFSSWRFDAFSLKESRPAKSGSQYKDIFVFPMGKR